MVQKNTSSEAPPLRSRDYKPGHRVSRVTAEKPSGTSWWTTVGRDGFTTEAVAREFKDVKPHGASMEKQRDSWSAPAKPKREAELKVID